MNITLAQKVSEVTVIEKYYGFITRAKSTSQTTKNFLHRLFKDEHFIDKTSYIRQKLNIPSSGYTLQDLHHTLENYHYWIEGLPLEDTEAYYRIQEQDFDENDLSKTKVIARQLKPFVQSLDNKKQEAIHNFYKKSRENPESGHIKDDKEYGKRPFSWDFFTLVQDDLLEIVQHFNLPTDFTKDFYYLICFNCIKNMSDDLDFEADSNKHSLIIPYKISKTALIKWIEKNWEERMKKPIEELPKFPRFRDKPNQLEIAEEIFNLRECQGMQFNEISDLLAEKYPNDRRCTDTGWIQVTLERYKDKILKK